MGELEHLGKPGQVQGEPRNALMVLRHANIHLSSLLNKASEMTANYLQHSILPAFVRRRLLKLVQVFRREETSIDE